MNRRVDPFDRRSMALSVTVHCAILVVAWASSLYEPEQMEFITYEIELVSPPPARQAEEPEVATEELVIERPEPEPAPPEPEVEEVVPIEEPDPEPDPPPVEREESTVPEPPEVAEEVVVAAAVDVPEEEPEETGEGLNVRMEGLQRDYPEYYDNIIRQIIRCFRWRDGGSWRTTVFFYIDRDGNAEGLDFVSRSGNTTFDYAAMGAVDCAGHGRFGALPEEFSDDRFPVQFFFDPRRAPLELFPVPDKPTEVTFQT